MVKNWLVTCVDWSQVGGRRSMKTPWEPPRRSFFFLGGARKVFGSNFSRFFVDILWKRYRSVRHLRGKDNFWMICKPLQQTRNIGDLVNKNWGFTQQVFAFLWQDMCFYISLSDVENCPEAKCSQNGMPRQGILAVKPMPWKDLRWLHYSCKVVKPMPWTTIFLGGSYHPDMV